MTGIVVWWTWLDDGVAHAVPRLQVGQRTFVLTTMCDRTVLRHRMDRSGHGPRCLLCRMRVGPN